MSPGEMYPGHQEMELRELPLGEGHKGELGEGLAWGHVDHQDDDNADDHNDTNDFDILEYYHGDLVTILTTMGRISRISTLVSLVCGDGHPRRHEGERGVLQDGRPRLQVGGDP